MKIPGLTNSPTKEPGRVLRNLPSQGVGSSGIVPPSTPPPPLPNRKQEMNALGRACSTMLVVKAVQFWKHANDVGNFSMGNSLKEYDLRIQVGGSGRGEIL